MKKLILLLLIVVSCSKYEESPFLEGQDLKDFEIFYKKEILNKPKKDNLYRLCEIDNVAIVYWPRQGVWLRVTNTLTKITAERLEQDEAYRQCGKQLIL